MRITNKMMTNNMLHNINVNKNNMSNLENKYSSGMEIQKPSDDPIVAVRALKLRTNLSELNQYYQKNIPDAMSWMEVTESALKNTSEIITKIHTYCTQGANDTLTVDERSSIVQNLRELKNQIYQEGNSNYAGRYLFTGFKTGTSLVFENAEKDLEYSITEEINSSQLSITNKIVNSVDVDNFDPDKTPKSQQVYRIRLSYDNLEAGQVANIGLKIPMKDSAGNTVKDDSGKIQYMTQPLGNVLGMTSSDDKAYDPADGSVNFLTDTGELILSESQYNTYKQYIESNDNKLTITYDKKGFEKNELRPEHYFTCEDKTNGISYEKEDQEITYEVNFNQRLAINIQAENAFRPSLGRAIEDIISAVSDVEAVNEKIANIEKKLKDENLTPAQSDTLNKTLNVLKKELSLKDSLMREAYGKCLTAMDEEENVVNAATSDIGTRYNRLELTQDRLSTQQVEFTDLLSQNEDADLVDTIVNYNAANTVYSASLQAAGKVVKNTLLDFI